MKTKKPQKAKGNHNRYNNRKTNNGNKDSKEATNIGKTNKT